MLKTVELEMRNPRSPEIRRNGKSPVDLGSLSIRSPKRRGGDSSSRIDWFSYYAGFSSPFVEDMLSGLELSSGAVLLDPWLGAGTTAEVARKRNLRVYGFDLNPAMLVVAKARTINVASADEVRKALAAIEETYRADAYAGKLTDHDLLDSWLKPGSVALMRALQQTIHSAFAEPDSKPGPIQAASISSSEAFLYLALFRTFRGFIEPFQTSNPTWIKIPETANRLSLTRLLLLKRFQREATLLLKELTDEVRVSTQPKAGSNVVIREGTSTKIDLSDESVDAIISSPPYCTRIDYVRATLPELAVIGFPKGPPVRDLRQKMIGTPTIKESPASAEKDWGPTCTAFLSAVKKHKSKASGTYYLNYYRQYFAGAYGSLKELDRVLKERGHCVLVVQDSFYKDVHNDLPAIFVEMGRNVGWRLERRIDFHVKRTLAGINPQVKEYRSTFQATEPVLIFSKGPKK